MSVAVVASENSIIINAIGTPIENGAALKAAYAAARLMTPNGAAKSATNRVRLVVAPGKYDFGGTAFIVDTDFIDIVSLTGNVDVEIWSSEIDVADTGSTYGIIINADDIFLKGINCGTNYFATMSSASTLLLENCTGGDFSFAGNSGTFLGSAANCNGGDFSFAGNSGTFSGTATNCTGGDGSFGSGGIFSGTATSCIGGDGSFGGAIGGTFSAIGRLYYCRLTAGTFPVPAVGGRQILCVDGTDAIITV